MIRRFVPVFRRESVPGQREQEATVVSRVAFLEVPPDRIDDAQKVVRDVVDAGLRGADGYVGYLVLGDRASGRVIGITLWESEEARGASDAKAAGLRPEVERATGGTMRAVEGYEVLYDVRHR
jgi:Antibiotic biosynthesis monooxygenase